jgi:hypothetical protein
MAIQSTVTPTQQPDGAQQKECFAPRRCCAGCRPLPEPHLCNLPLRARPGNHLKAAFTPLPGSRVGLRDCKVCDKGYTDNRVCKQQLQSTAATPPVPSSCCPTVLLFYCSQQLYPAQSMASGTPSLLNTDGFLQLGGRCWSGGARPRNLASAPPSG